MLPSAQAEETEAEGLTGVHRGMGCGLAGKLAEALCEGHFIDRDYVRIYSNAKQNTLGGGKEYWGERQSERRRGAVRED